MWASALSAAAAIFKAIAAGLGLIHDAQEQKAGALAQANADLNATVKADQDARIIETGNAELGRAALLAKLHDQSTGG